MEEIRWAFNRVNWTLLDEQLSAAEGGAT